jgi:hypothetical protein
MPKKKSAANTLLEALDLGALAPDDQEDIMLTVSDLVFRGSLVRLMERMDEAERDRFAALVAAGVPEGELLDFLKTVPGAEDVVRETVDELKGDILHVTKP